MTGLRKRPGRIFRGDQAEELFVELLAARRRAMGEANRRKQAAALRRSSPPWLYPAATESRYRNQIREWLRQITRPAVEDVSENIEGWVEEVGITDSARSDQFGPEVASLIERLNGLHTDLFVDGRDSIVSFLTSIGFVVSDFNKGQSDKLRRRVLGEDFSSEELWEFDEIDSWAATNHDLVSNASEEFIRKTNTLVRDGVFSGRTAAAIREDIQKLDHTISRSRAALIARDQVGKLNGRLTQRRQRDVGVSSYIWRTALDERVRGRPGGRYPNAIPSHWSMEGMYGRWDNPRVVSDDGREFRPKSPDMPMAHPGMEIQCRCAAIPNWDPILEAADRAIAEGG